MQRSGKDSLVEMGSVMLHLVLRNLVNFNMNKQDDMMNFSRMVRGRNVTISFCSGLPEPLSRDWGYSLSRFWLLCNQWIYTMKLLIESRDELRIIKLDEVVYLKASGNYTDFHYINGWVKSELACLSAFEKRISNLYGTKPSPFFRAGRSFLVNIDYIANISLQKQSVKFSTGEMITLPKFHIRTLKDTIIGNHLSNNNL